MEMMLVDREVVKASIKHYGKDMQSTVCMEECAELIQAISKCKRGKAELYNLCEEIADVTICIDMLQEIYGIEDKDVFRMIEKKQRREMDRIQCGE